MTPVHHNDLLLDVRNLRTSFFIEGGEVRAVDGASFSLRRGRTLAIVGESGCGKSVTAYSVLRLIQPPGRIVGGQILFHPRDAQPIDLAALHDKSDTLFKVRGGMISMIFQEPMTALSPVHTIGNQISEAILLHQPVTKQQADDIAATMLGKVGIPNPAGRLKQYPYEISGGMRQRVVIAMALACNPQLLIADEPTTALDVTIQAQILALIKSLQADLGTAVLLITHDLGVVAQVADDVAVMYLGRIVEHGPMRDVIKNPRHPYTRGLLQSRPNLDGARRDRLPSIEGTVPSLTAIPTGCPFHPRCPHAKPGLCDVGAPPTLDPRGVACVRAEEIAP
jgi:oligopeptide/dipeptide ABC transporter ATP-binding protein